MFCAPELVFGGAECIGSRFHVLRIQTHFRRYRGRRVPHSCFVLPDSFSAVPETSGPFFMFCPPGLVFDGTVGVGSRCHVLRSRTRFRWYRGYQVPFSCCALPDSFSAVPGVSGPVFMFCVLELFFGDTEAVGSCFHVLCPQTRFWRCRGRPIPFSCLPHPGMFLAVPRASGPFVIFCTPGLVFGGTEGVGSYFHVLRSQTHFRRYRGRRVPFSCFALPESFSAVSRASGPICMFCAPGLIFGGTEGTRSLFHVLHSRTHFLRYRGCRVPFSCFACPYSFSTVRRSSGPVFISCAPRLVFGGAECVGSRFHVLRARAHFGWYRGRRVPFSSFALPDSFLTVPRASGPVFLFCAHELIFGGTEGVVSCFHVLCSRTHFRRCRVHWVPFSCFARPDSFSAVPRASGPVFMFCAPILVFGGTGGVRSLFHVLPFETRFRRY
jgi:hypothetical protein